jgi:hypothetical protein
MKKIFLIILFMNLLIIDSYSEDTELNIQIAIEKLSCTDTLQVLSLDGNGKLEDNIFYFYYLLKNNDPYIFYELFNKSKTIEGKLYALIGIFFINKESYFRYKKSIKNTTIKVFVGDTGIYETSYDLLKDLEIGDLENLLFWNIDRNTWSIIMHNGTYKKFFNDNPNISDTEF